MKKFVNMSTLAGMTVGSLLMLQTARADTVCYDFSNSVVGTTYSTGESISTPAATIEIRKLRTLDGTQISNSAQMANIVSSSQAGSVSPELHGYFVNTRIVPYQPLTTVTLLLAQNTGGDNAYLYSNLSINGETVQLKYGLGSANGLVLGNDTEGQVLVTTDIEIPVSGQPAHWINGTVELTALTGSINRFSLGSPQYKMDDVCLIQ